MLTQLSEYPYHTIHPLSPSHVREGSYIGLAVLSKFPLADIKLIILPNPELKFAASDGSFVPLHAKGLLTALVSTPHCVFNVICAHLYPFKSQRRRPGEPIFDSMRQAFRTAVENFAQKPLIIGADLNMDQLDEFTPGLSDKLRLLDLIGRPTHWLNGAYVRADHILCTPEWTVTNARVLPTRFDHHLCYTRLVPIARPMLKVKPANAAGMAKCDFTVMHLSDLHYGTASQTDVDWKVWIDGAERTQRVGRLPSYINRLPICPDFVVVSGDITIAGDPIGFAAFEKALVGGITERKLPDTRHTIIVPGNHDVSRKTAPRSNQRWDEFQQRFGSRFVIPWLPVHDNPDRLLERMKVMDLENTTVIGGANTTINPVTGLSDSLPLPFTFDRARKVLFYAFNSALIAGSQLEAGAELEKFLTSLSELGDAPPNLNGLMKDLTTLRQVDPSRIEPVELELFHGIVEILRRRLPNEFHRCIKIAVLHHHVVPFIPEEIKQFELLLNAGQFKKHLTDAGFQVVMHGHKHWPDMVVDSALTSGSELLVISGGTIGGGPSEGKPGFNWLVFELNDEQLSVSRHFIPVTSDSVEDTIEVALSSPCQARRVSLRRRVASQNLTSAPSFRQVSQSMELALLRNLVTLPRVSTSEEKRAGWNNYIGDDSVSVLGTAYASLAMATIDSRHHAYLAAQPWIKNYLLAMRRKNGLWSSTANREPGQPLESCIVLSALLSMGYEDAELIAQKLLDDFSSGMWPALFESTYAVTMFLQFGLSYAPDTSAIFKLLSILEIGACRGVENQLFGWGQSTGFNIAKASTCASNTFDARLEPTPLYTALALWVLALAKERVGESVAQSLGPVDGAVRFLIEQPWDLCSETIDETSGKSLLFNHNTPVIALSALLLSGIDAQHSRILQGVRSIIESQSNGLWDCGSIRRPSWCTLDNIRTLKLYSDFSQLN